MATITAGDFRNGKTFEMDGKIMQVVEFQHVKPGKGAAFVRTKAAPLPGLTCWKSTTCMTWPSISKVTPLRKSPAVII